MKAHELAHKLLAGENLHVVVRIDSFDEEALTVTKPSIRDGWDELQKDRVIALYTEVL